MKKIYNSHYSREAMTIMPGEYYISTEQELIGTLLGSCIAACLYDEKSGVSGMNHFLLPRYAGKDGDLYSSARYGVTAMEMLIMKMQLKGADRDLLKAKIFGGGNVLSLSQSPERVGERNISFIHEYLKTEGISIVSEDTGGYFSRKVLFNTEDFSVQLRKIPVDATIVNNEVDYFDRITKIQEKTEIVYF